MQTINSTSDVLKLLYNLSLNQTNFRFRGQADSEWQLIPAIYRYYNFERYQTIPHEDSLFAIKPANLGPPLIHTGFNIEWLMLCQHYGIPTRLLDWTSDILIALFFACHGNEQIIKDGALYICKQDDYPFFFNYEDSLMDHQSLAFLSTNIINPRMRNQSGCFMMWGHAPIKNDSTETYDLISYQQLSGKAYFFEKLLIPSKSKKNILRELRDIYSISYGNLYLTNGYFEKRYLNFFKQCKKMARIMTLHITQPEKLNNEERVLAKTFFSLNVENMIGGCVNLRMIK